jgi:hypothetical protein
MTRNKARRTLRLRPSSAIEPSGDSTSMMTWHSRHSVAHSAQSPAGATALTQQLRHPMAVAMAAAGRPGWAQEQRMPPLRKPPYARTAAVGSAGVVPVVGSHAHRLCCSHTKLPERGRAWQDLGPAYHRVGPGVVAVAGLRRALAPRAAVCGHGGRAAAGAERVGL